MGIVLGFLPFIIMVLGTRLLSVDVALPLALFVAVFNVGVTLLARRTPKILAIGNLLLFGGALAWGDLAGVAWTQASIGLVSNGGLALVVLFSIAIGKPFTLQYAVEQVPPEVQASPRFLFGNRVLSGAWALAFLMMLAINAVAVAGIIPPAISSPLNIGVLCAGGFFTWWFPRRMKARAAVPTPGAV